MSEHLLKACHHGMIFRTHRKLIIPQRANYDGHDNKIVATSTYGLLSKYSDHRTHELHVTG